MTGFQNPTGNVFYRVNEGSVLEQELKALGWEEVSPDLANEDQYLAVPELSQIDMFIQTSAKYDDLILILQMLKAAGLGDPDSLSPDALTPRPTYPQQDTTSGTSPASASVEQNQSANLDTMNITKLRKEAKALGIDPSGLDKDQLIDRIEYAQQNQQQDDYQQ